jgi:hypothetical protein
LTIIDVMKLLFRSKQILAWLECLRIEAVDFGRPGRALLQKVRFGLTEKAFNRRGGFCPEWNIMESGKLVLA